MTDAPFKRFLLVFDPATGAAAEVLEFDSVGPALDAYREMERRYRGRSAVQVVLLGADSLETVKTTHSNYFGDSSVQGVKSALRQQQRRTAI